MAGDFTLVGVEAVVLGIAAFQRDAASVNSLLASIGSTTNGLSLSGPSAFAAVGSAATAAFGAVVLGAGAATVALAGVASGVVDVAASFEQNLLRTTAVVNATVAQTQSLSDTIIKVGATTRLSMTDVSNAANELVRSGFSLQQVEGGVLDATVKLAEASGGKLGVAEAAKLVSEGMLAWGLSASQVGTVTSSLLAVANSSAIGFGDLNTIFRQTAPIAAGLGIPIQDLSAAIGVMGQQGISGTIAGSALKDVLVKLADPSKNALVQMKAYGVSLQDAAGNVVPLRQVIERLSAAYGDAAIATGKMTEATRARDLAVLFGTRGIEAGIALARGGVTAFDQMSVAIANTDPSVLAAKMRDSLIPQLDVLRNTVQGLIVQFGTPLEQALTKGLEKFNSLLQGINNQMPKALGDALLAAFSGGGISSSLNSELQAVFGADFAKTIEGAISILQALRDAIMNRIVPAFEIFFTAIFGGIDATKSFGDFLSTVAVTITTVAKYVSEAIVVFANFITQLRTSTGTSLILSAAIKGLIALPVIGFILILGQIAIAVGTAIAPVLLLSLAVTQLIAHASDIQTAFQSAFAGVTTSIQQPTVAMKVLESVIGAIATLGLISLLADMRVALVGFGAEILATAKDVLIMSTDWLYAGSSIVVGIGRAVFETLVWASATTESLIPAVGNAIIAVGKFIVTIVAQGAALVAQTAVTIASYATQAASVVAALAAQATAAVTSGAVATGAWILQATSFGVMEEEIVVGLTAIEVATAEYDAFMAESMIATSVAVDASVGATLLTTLRAAGARLLALGAQFVALATGGITTAITAMRAFAVAEIESLAAGLIVIAPFIVGLLAIVATVIVVKIAWDNNWLGMRDTLKTNTAGMLTDLQTWGVNITANEYHIIDEIRHAFDPTVIVHSVDEYKKQIVSIGESSNTMGKQVSDDFTALKKAVADAMASAGVSVNGWVHDLLVQFGLADKQIVTTISYFDALAQSIARFNFIKQQTDTRQKTEGSAWQTPFTDTSLPALPSPAVDTTGGISYPTPVGGAKAASGKGKLEQLTDDIQKLIATLPGATSALAAYLAQLETDVPGREPGMVAALLKEKTTLDEMNTSYQRMLVLDQAIAQVTASISTLTQQQSLIDAQTAAQTAPIEAQILDLRSQALAVQAQLLPIEQAIAAIDRQIAAINATNLDYEKQVLQIQVQMLPIQQQIAAVDKQIADAQRINYTQAIAVAQLEQQALPITQKIADLNTQINRIVDQRGQLLTRNNEIIAQQAVDAQTSELRHVNTALDAAWTTLNVPQILALEARKTTLTTTIVTAQNALSDIQDQQKLTAQNDELAQNALKLQIVDQQSLLNTILDQTTAITNQQAIDAAASKIIVLGLDQQKQALQDILAPMQAQLDAVNNIKAAQDLQNKLAINALEQQKAALELLAEPLRLQLQNLNDQIAGLQAQKDQIDAVAAAEKGRIDVKLAQDKLELASLDTIKASETARFDALATDYLTALTNSKAFTASEATQTLTRLGLTDSEIAKIGALAATFNSGGPGSVTKAIADVSAALAAIPDKTVHIHIVTDNIPSFATGGIVGGQFGSPQLIIAHGGEQFMGVGNTAPLFAHQPGVGNSAQGVVNNNTTYQVNATYANQQSPASVAMDLRAIKAMVGH